MSLDTHGDAHRANAGWGSQTKCHEEPKFTPIPPFPLKWGRRKSKPVVHFLLYSNYV